jgi:hypothetical protein
MKGMTVKLTIETGINLRNLAKQKSRSSDETALNLLKKH